MAHYLRWYMAAAIKSPSEAEGWMRDAPDLAVRAAAVRAVGATALEQLSCVADATRVPVLANITEFGQTPLWSADKLADAGVSLILYPLSSFRAMAKASARVFEVIRRDGTQREVLTQMQTRAELYDTLDYERYEARADTILARSDSRG